MGSSGICQVHGPDSLMAQLAKSGTLNEENTVMISDRKDLASLAMANIVKDNKYNRTMFKRMTYKEFMLSGLVKAEQQDDMRVWWFADTVGETVKLMGEPVVEVRVLFTRWSDGEVEEVGTYPLFMFGATKVAVVAPAINDEYVPPEKNE